MGMRRLLRSILGLVTCGVTAFRDVDEDAASATNGDASTTEFLRVQEAEDVAIVLDDDMTEETSTESAETEQEEEEDEPQPVERLDSLERGFQSVMERARVFAQKWSQSTVVNELLFDQKDQAEQTHSENEMPRQDDIELEVARDSSQARFEELMHRTSLFYHRCSMLQRHPSLLVY